MPTVPIEAKGLATIPLAVTPSTTTEVTMIAAYAEWDGTRASGAFLPCIAIYAQDGSRLGRMFPSSSVAAGDTAVITYAPFPGGIGGLTVNNFVLPFLDFVSFTPAGNRIQVASSNPAAPTTIITGNAVAYDGLTTIQILFYASAIDCDSRVSGTLGGVLLELYDGATALGVVGDWNCWNGQYFVTSLYVSAILTPSAGTHTYSIAGYTTASPAPQPVSYVYGTGISTPHTTRPGYFAIIATKT